MHEWHITEALLEIVCKQAADNRLKKVSKIEVGLGRDSEVTEDSLRFCLASLSEKTIAKGAELEIRQLGGSDVVLVSLEGE